MCFYIAVQHTQWLLTHLKKSHFAALQHGFLL